MPSSARITFVRCLASSRWYLTASRESTRSPISLRGSVACSAEAVTYLPLKYSSGSTSQRPCSLSRCRLPYAKECPSANWYVMCTDMGEGAPGSVCACCTK